MDLTGRQQTTEPRLRMKFRAWLDELDDRQIRALDENWDNVMNDAALDRVDSWVIARVTIAKLRERLSVQPESETLGDQAATEGDT